MTPVPTTPTVFTSIFFLLQGVRTTISLALFGAFPNQISHYLCARRLNWGRGAEMKSISLDLHNARVRLADPARIQRDCHGVSQSLLRFVDMEGTGIGDVATAFFAVLGRSSLKPDTGCKLA